MPDKLGVKPDNFFNNEKAKSYEKSNTIIKSQIEISDRIRELLNLRDKKIILDIGCGTGITSEYFINLGHNVVGIDISYEMLRFADKKNIPIINADFKNIPFRNNLFESIISVSALQWVWGSSREEVIMKYNMIVKDIKRICKKDCLIGIQFYPETDTEFSIVSKIFSKNGFKGSMVIDRWKNSKKNKKYLILKLTT